MVVKRLYKNKQRLKKRQIIPTKSVELIGNDLFDLNLCYDIP